MVEGGVSRGRAVALRQGLWSLMRLLWTPWDVVWTLCRPGMALGDSSHFVVSMD